MMQQTYKEIPKSCLEVLQSPLLPVPLLLEVVSVVVMETVPQDFQIQMRSRRGLEMCPHCLLEQTREALTWLVLIFVAV